MAGLIYGVEVALGILAGTGLGLAVGGLFWPRAGLFGVGILCTIDSPARVFLMTGGLWRWNSFNYFLLLIQPATGVFHMLGIAAVVGLLVFFERARDLESLYWLGVVCATLGAFGAFVFFLQASSFTAINANAFSYMPLTGLFAASMALIAASKPRRGILTLSVLAAANLTAVFLTGSRGALLVAVWCALCFVIAIPGLGKRAMALSLALLLTLGLSSQFTSLQDRAVTRVDKLLDRERSLRARTSGRYDLAIGGLKIFWANPLGVGTGAYSAHWVKLTKQERFTSFRRGRWTEAHSAWIETLAENGVLGACLLAAYVLSFAVVGMRLGGAGRMLGIMTTGVLALAFLSTGFNAKGLWLLAAGATALLQRGGAIGDHGTSG
jgi:hypothetical protein